MRQDESYRPPATTSPAEEGEPAGFADGNNLQPKAWEPADAEGTFLRPLYTQAGECVKEDTLSVDASEYLASLEDAELDRQADEYTRLVRGVQAGRQHERELVRELRPKMLGAAGAMLGRASTDAEDVVQDAIERLLRHIERVEKPGSIESFAFTTVRNCVRHLRRRRARDLVRDELELPNDSVDADARICSATMEIGRGIVSLPDRHRTALLLDVLGFTGSEISTLLGVPAGTVRQQLSSARKRLRECRTD